VPDVIEHRFAADRAAVDGALEDFCDRLLARLRGPVEEAIRYGTLGGGTSETLRELLGKRIMAGLDPIDGILSLEAF